MHIITLKLLQKIILAGDANIGLFFDSATKTAYSDLLDDVSTNTGAVKGD